MSVQDRFIIISIEMGKGKMAYNYPLRSDWKTDEIVKVIAFYDVVERAYESSIGRTELMDAYRVFKEIVPSKSEEKTLFKEFEEASGYGSYQVVKKAIDGVEKIQMKGMKNG